MFQTFGGIFHKGPFLHTHLANGGGCLWGGQIYLARPGQVRWGDRLGMWGVGGGGDRRFGRGGGGGGGSRRMSRVSRDKLWEERGGGVTLVLRRRVRYPRGTVGRRAELAGPLAVFLFFYLLAGILSSGPRVRFRRVGGWGSPALGRGGKVDRRCSYHEPFCFVLSAYTGGG